jgi:hypothetical protein
VRARPQRDLGLAAVHAPRRYVDPGGTGSSCTNGSRPVSLALVAAHALVLIGDPTCVSTCWICCCLRLRLSRSAYCAGRAVCLWQRGCFWQLQVAAPVRPRTWRIVHILVTLHGLLAGTDSWTSKRHARSLGRTQDKFCALSARAHPEHRTSVRGPRGAPTLVKQAANAPGRQLAHTWPAVTCKCVDSSPRASRRRLSAAGCRAWRAPAVPTLISWLIMLIRGRRGTRHCIDGAEAGKSTPVAGAVSAGWKLRARRWRLVSVTRQEQSGA